MSIDMSQFYQVFFEESAEHLAEMESLLLGLDVAAPDPEALNAIFRAAHSIKGSSGTFGFTDLAELTHVLENLLDKIRKQEITLQPDMVDAFLETGDLLKTMLAAHQGGSPADPACIVNLSQRLQLLTDGRGVPVAGQCSVSGAVGCDPATGTVPAGAACGDAGGAVGSSPAAALQDGAPGGRGFLIEFVPTLASAGAGVASFVAELQALGRVDILIQPPENEPVGFWSLRLVAAELPASVGEQLDFIAERDAWRIEEDRSLGADGEEAFGFFGDAPGLSDEARGYGFFEPLPGADGVAESSADAEAAYGFFEPLPELPAEALSSGQAGQPLASGTVAASHASPAADPEGAYGFFDPLPAAPESDAGFGFFSQDVLLPAPVAAAGLGSLQDADDGSYGFFAPLPAATDVPAVLSPEPVAPVPPAQAGGQQASHPGPVPAAVPVNATPGLAAATSDASAPTATSMANPVANPVATPATTETVAPRAPAVAVQAKKAAAGGSDSSIRVSVEKVDQLINLVGELVITQAMLLQTVSQMQDAAPERLINGLAQLERNSRDLQESVMSIRMLPISFVFSRFPRVVRDLSGKLGKQVELKTIGDTTELDKGLIERIADPLTHLIRNSLDHGIESPEKRVAVGKQPCGTITLKASHQGGNVVIEVGDDGAGLNREKILAKARERGLQVSDQMSDQDVFALIFEAGFSTADQVTDVSGRGVGMDVVRRNIQALGGRIEIESMLGIGTRMTVRLPLTLAILDGMSVAVGDQTYILPLSYVMESLQPEPGDIKTLANQGRVIQVRGEYLPVVALHEVFNIQKAVTHFSQGIMVVLNADGAAAALFVDALVGQHQVVIKSLEANYRRVPGISGATIMGDGHVALILDVSAIVGMGKQQMQKGQSRGWQRPEEC